MVSGTQGIETFESDVNDISAHSTLDTDSSDVSYFLFLTESVFKGYDMHKAAFC